MFKLEIETDNAAFADNEVGSEISRILHRLASDARLALVGDDTLQAEFPLVDCNGNRVGTAVYTLAALSAPAWDRARLARALRKATVQLNVGLGECNVVNYAPAAGDDRNPGGLCGPCCDLLAVAIISAMEADRD